jgi:hypothetical protein
MEKKEKKIETIEIVARDFYGDNCLNDSISANLRSKTGKPEGFVEVYEVDDSGNKKLLTKNNLVLYVGREWIAQRIVNIENLGVPSSKDEFITWFGLGDGGVILGDPLNPSPPVLTDTGLSSQVMITTVGGTVADYNTADATHPETGYYKIPFDSVDFEQDTLNDDKWLVVKITVTVGVTYANDKELSEAGLFTAQSSAGGYAGQFTAFSRVTFPSIVKTSDRRLIFVWFLYV